MKIFLAIFVVVQVFLLLNAQFIREMTWGVVEDGSRLEINERVTQPGTPNNGTFLTRTFTTNGTITGFRTIDIINAVSLASTELVSGGLGREEVTLLFSTPLAGHALDYRVEIFTSASFQTKASFLIIMITSLITFLQLK